jgi:hypothetical protein
MSANLWTEKIRLLLKRDRRKLLAVSEVRDELGIPKSSTANSSLQALRKRGLADSRFLEPHERPEKTKGRHNKVWFSLETEPEPKPELPRPSRPPTPEPDPEQPQVISPEMKVCPSCGAPRKRMLCDGSGATLVQKPLWEGHPVLYDVQEICPYRVAVKVRQGMDPSIRAVPPYAGTPTPLIDEPNPFLFFNCSWRTLARNVQSFILNQPDPMNFVCRITSDREILEVRLGNQTEEDQKDTRISLSAFMRPPHLVVIRLGELGYPNKAAGGYLYEAVIARVRDNKPTWLQCPPSNPYRPEHLTWDAQLNHLFDTLFNQSPKFKFDKLDRGVAT